jgi:hypothetical protein
MAQGCLRARHPSQSHREWRPESCHRGPHIRQGAGQEAEIIEFIPIKLQIPTEPSESDITV